MGNTESIIDPEILSCTQLVGSYIQKRSSLNYQINQLKLALNTKKTCIETKKLRDLKAKNSSLAIEINHSFKLLEKIRQKKYIKYKDKDLSKSVSHFLTFVNKKRKLFTIISEDIVEHSNNYENQKQFYKERQNYLSHLLEKIKKNSEKIQQSSESLSKLKDLTETLKILKANHAQVTEKKSQIQEKHSKLLARRRIKRRQTLIVHKLPNNAVMLRSKLLLKSELQNQINELIADQSLHLEQQQQQKLSLELNTQNKADLEALEKLISNTKLLNSKIFKYKSELELFNSSVAPSPILRLRDIEDSLHTDIDVSSDSLVN